MTVRVRALAVLSFALVLTLACGKEAPEERGGFPNDTRATFAGGDPYEALSRVAWRPWSDRAFEDAGKKPILLDLSGLWCHYCHVYDQVVYRDDPVPSFINDNFIPVRVDADRRPDLNARYNRGGWPSLVVLTPEGDIVGGATYDPERVYEFLQATLAVYRSGGDSLRTVAVEQRRRLAQQQSNVRESGQLDADILRRVVAGLKNIWDVEYGGFLMPGDARGKLASPRTLKLLLDEAITNPTLDPELPSFMRTTLDGMEKGAIRDHLFGGFFRSVGDRAWSVPHFEKLLSTQATTAELYVAAAPLWATERYRNAAVDAIEFTFEFLGNPDGVTFANAMDPDMGPGDDGAFYTWTVAEVDSLLSEEEAAAIKFYYGIAPAGELGSRPGANTLYESYEPDEAAARRGVDAGAFKATLERARSRMRAARLAGSVPRVDPTAYAAPNLEMAIALLAAYESFEDPKYLARARSIIDFFTDTHLDPKTGVPHGFDGQSILPLPLLSNQVAGIRALLRAYAVTKEATYLTRAESLAELTRSVYANAKGGGYWDRPADATGRGLLELKLRPLEQNCRLAEAYMDLFVATARSEYRDAAERILGSFTESFASAGITAVDYAVAVNRLLWRLRGESS